MTLPYILTRSAAADLNDIVRHTAQTWGQDQCRDYVAQHEKAATELALGQGIFRSRDDLLPGLRYAGRGTTFCFVCPGKTSPP